MSKNTMSLRELRRAGIEALAKVLGPLETARFLQQYDMGKGDYTKERAQWLDHLTMEEIYEGIRKLQEKKQKDLQP